VQINDPAVVAEVTLASDVYERALIDNDVEALMGFFWDSAQALRIGVAEELYGSEPINEFRRKRTVSFTDRKTLGRHVVAFGADMAIVTIEFSVVAFGNPRHGRQSQVWVKLGDAGWRVVSAHVSHRVTPQNSAAFSTNANDGAAFAAAASAILRAPIDPAHLGGVAFNVGLMSNIAAPLMEIELPETVEPAARFIP
jgi:hypothetical protein